MRSLAFAGEGQIEWRDAPDSELRGDSEALVRSRWPPATSTFAPGDIVSVPFQISCGECDRCRRYFLGGLTPPLAVVPVAFGRRAAICGCAKRRRIESSEAK